jgi:hypothetical protein
LIDENVMTQDEVNEKVKSIREVLNDAYKRSKDPDRTSSKVSSV